MIISPSKRRSTKRPRWVGLAGLLVGAGTFLAFGGPHGGPTATFTPQTATESLPELSPMPWSIPVANAQSTEVPVTSQAEDAAPESSDTANSDSTRNGTNGNITKHVLGATGNSGRAARKVRLQALLKRLGGKLPEGNRELKPIPQSAGYRRVELGNGFHHAVVAHRNANGTTSYGCFDNHEHAVEFLLDSQAEE